MFKNYRRMPEDQNPRNTARNTFLGINMDNSDGKMDIEQNSSNIILGQLKSIPTTTSPSTLPLISHTNETNAPIARIEIDDDTNKEPRTNDENNTNKTTNIPYPGIDDGFFTNEKDDNKPSTDSDNPEVELLNPPSDREYPEVDLTPRLGPDDENSKPTDEPDTNSLPQPQPPVNPNSDIPKIYPPPPPSEFPGNQPGGIRSWGIDWEMGTNVNTLPSGESIPDLNVYQHKKTLAQGMMDLALFSANANQLRYVLETFRTHPYFYPSLILISISLLMQVAVGIGLIWNATYNVKDKRALCIANKINNFTIIGVFLVTVINVFISAFGVAPAPP